MANVNDYNWTDPATGLPSAPGVGTPTPKDTSSTTAATSSVTPALTLTEANKQADTALSSGLVSPMSLSDIRDREAAQKASSAKSVEAQFAPQIQREQVSGARSVAAAEGTLAGGGVGAGSGIGSAQMAFLAATQTDVNNRVKLVEDQKATALAAGDLAAVTKADEAISKLNEYNNNLTLAKANYALQLMGQNTSQQNLELQRQEQAQKAIDTANTLKIQQQAADANLIDSLAKISTGETITVNGVTYKGLSKETIDPSLVEISYDDKGFATGKNKLTGKVLWTSTTPTGKSKSETRVSVNVPNYQTNPAYSASTGKQLLWRVDSKSAAGGYFVDPVTQKTVPQSEIPSDIRVGTFAAGNPVTDDITSLIQGISGVK